MYVLYVPDWCPQRSEVTASDLLELELFVGKHGVGV